MKVKKFLDLIFSALPHFITLLSLFVTENLPPAFMFGITSLATMRVHLNTVRIFGCLVTALDRACNPFGAAKNKK